MKGHTAIKHNNFIYALGHLFFSLYFKLFFRWSFRGLENVPAEGPFIICSNHTSWFDPPLVGCMLPRKNKVFFMAKEELFDIIILGKIIRKMGAFPVKRDEADRKAITFALKVLQEGNILALFPEGTRSKDGSIGEPFQGPAMIALKSKKPVLPVAIKWPSRVFLPVKVNIGPPVVFDEERKIKKDLLDKTSTKIMEEIRDLFRGL